VDSAEFKRGGGKPPWGEDVRYAKGRRRPETSAVLRIAGGRLEPLALGKNEEELNLRTNAERGREP